MYIYSAEISNNPVDNGAIVVTRNSGRFVDGVLYVFQNGVDTRIGETECGAVVCNGVAYSDSKESAVGALYCDIVRKMKQNPSPSFQANLHTIRFWYGKSGFVA